MGIALLAVPMCAFAQWQQKATNPSWFPYDQSWNYPANVPPPALSVLFPDDPFPEAATQGWWPRYIASGAFANEHYYVLGGEGDMTYDPDLDGGPAWGYGVYADNRQSGVDAYDPATNTWSSSKWDGTGPASIGYLQDMFVYTSVGSGAVVPPPSIGEDPWGSSFRFWDLSPDGTELRYQVMFNDLTTGNPGGPPRFHYLMEIDIRQAVPGYAGPIVKTLWSDSSGLPADSIGDWNGRANGFWTGITPPELTALANGELYIELVGYEPSGLLTEAYLRGQLYHTRSDPVHWASTKLTGYAAGAANTGSDGNVPPVYDIGRCPSFTMNSLVRDSADQDPSYYLKMNVSMSTWWFQQADQLPGETITKLLLKQKSTGTVLLTLWDSTAAGGPPPRDINQDWTDAGNATYAWWKPLTDAKVAIINAEDLVFEMYTDIPGPGPRDEALRALGLPQIMYDPYRNNTRGDFGQGGGMNSAAAYDRNGDGIKEIYCLARYPWWGGNFAIYDPADNTMSMSSDMPDAPGLDKSYSYGNVCLYHGQIYCLGAYYNFVTLRYDIATDTWEVGNTALTWNMGVTVGGVLTDPFGDAHDYYISTYDETPDTAFLKYDLTNASAPGGLQTEDFAYTGHYIDNVQKYACAGFVFGNKLYVAGGRDLNTGLHDLVTYVYDGTGNAVDAGNNLPQGCRWMAAAVDPVCGVAYLGGALRTEASWSYSTSILYTTNLMPSAMNGDSNCDGAVDFDDINPFVAALVGEAGWQGRVPAACWPGFLCFNDINRDGAVNFDDINPFVRCLVAGACP
jgi:hypothetical protein